MSSSRSRILGWFTALGLALLASVQGCDCGSTDFDTRRFACTEDEECTSGFVCLQGECRPEGSVVTDGGVDGGLPDGGDGGPTGGMDGGTDGGPTDGTDGGTDGGPLPTDGGPTTDGGTPPDGGTPSRPTSITFATPAQTVSAGNCSGTTFIEARDTTGTAAPVASNTVLSLVSQPVNNFAFFSDPSCTTSASTVTMAAGTSRATFYFRGVVARTFRVTVAASGLGSTQQTETITPGAPSSLGFTSSAQTLQAGACSSRADLELRDAYGNTVTPTAQTSAALLAQESSNIVFFTDSACANPTSTAVFAAGATRASFYFKTKTGGAFTLVAAASGLTSATQTVTILPVVRSGTCTLPTGAGSVTCPISPPQVSVSKTLMMFQASSNDGSPDTASLNCSLTSVSGITCSRQDFDDGNEPSVFILWQTAELASGLNVQHLRTGCAGAATTELPITPVASLQNTFLLVSSEQDGSTQGDDDDYAASMSAVDHVDLDFSVTCQSSWKASVQVVEYQGTTVTRNITGPMSGTQLVVSNLPAVDPASTALLFTFRSSNTSSSVMCDRILRGELSSPTSITFSRGDGATGCTGASIDAISWERIQFGGRAQAQHFQVAMGANTTAVNATLGTPVDTTRTLVFASGQVQSGQSTGETSYAGDDIIGTALGWHTLTSPTNMRVTRGAAQGTAKFHSTALQLEP